MLHVHHVGLTASREFATAGGTQRQALGYSGGCRREDGPSQISPLARPNGQRDPPGLLQKDRVNPADAEFHGAVPVVTERRLLPNAKKAAGFPARLTQCQRQPSSPVSFVEAR